MESMFEKSKRKNLMSLNSQGDCQDSVLVLVQMGLLTYQKTWDEQKEDAFKRFPKLKESLEHWYWSEDFFRNIIDNKTTWEDSHMKALGVDIADLGLQEK